MNFNLKTLLRMLTLTYEDLTGEENPYNAQKTTMSNAMKKDFKRHGEWGKARPIWSCLALLLWAIFIAYLIIDLIIKWE